MNKNVLDYFKKVDKVLYKVALKVVLEKGPIEAIKPISKNKYFEKLCVDIVGQQLSGKVADVIWKRVEDLFSSKKVTAAGILRLKDENLRQTGAVQQLTNLVNAAQEHQTVKTEGVPFVSSPYGDDPVDQYWIQQGMQYYYNYLAN